MKIRHLCSLGLALTCAACGGLVVFVEDDDGAAGDGAAGSGGGATGAGGDPTTSFDSSSVITSGTQCELLQVDLQSANALASACDPFVNMIQCDGSAVVNDTCGCPAVLANETEPELVSAANDAYKAWVDAGCGPFPCESCTPAQPGFCQVQPDTVTGLCVFGVF